MKKNHLFSVFLLLMFPALLQAAKTLEIYVIDTEGGKSLLIVSPSGRSMLVDTGFPGNNDRDTNRIALSRKRLLPDPWSDAMNRYHEGQQVEGTVTNVVDFGAFIALDDGLEGLLHLSEMGDGTLKEPHSYVKKGDRLQLTISRLEPDKRRVGFTQRWGVSSEPATAQEPGEAENVAESGQNGETPAEA